MRIRYISSFIIVASTLVLISNHVLEGAKRLGITSGEFFHVSHHKEYRKKSKVYKKDTGYLKYGGEVPLIINIGSLEIPLIKSPYSISYISSLILKLLWDKTRNFLYLRFINVATFWVCSLILYLLMIKRIDFWSAVVGSIAFQIHLSFISYLYEMNYVILSYLCFYAGLLLRGFWRLFFFLLSIHLNTLWMIIFFIVYFVIKFLFRKDISYLKKRSFTNISFLNISFLIVFSLVLIVIPILFLFSHPNFIQFYDLTSYGNDALSEKIKVIFYLFTFPHVVFLPILFISFILSLIMISKKKDNFGILCLNVSGFAIFALSILFLLVFVEDKQTVFDLFSRWRKYYSLFTPFAFFPIFNFFSGIFGKLVRFFLFAFLLILSLGLGGVKFSRDPKVFEGQRKELFAQTGYGMDIQIQREITEFLMRKIEENSGRQLRVVFISSPLSIGFAFVLSGGKISADYMVCSGLLEPRKNFDILVLDLSCKDAEDLVKKIMTKHRDIIIKPFPEYGEKYFSLITFVP